MIQDTINRIRLTWRLVRDGRVSLNLKLIPALGVLYVVSPFDLIPFFPIDDITVLLFMLKFFVDSVPEAIVNEHRQQLGIPLEVSND